MTAFDDMPFDELVAAANEMFVHALRAVEQMPTDDLEPLGAALIALDGLRANLATVRDACEKRLVESMEELPEITVPGAVLQKRRSDSRKAWSHADLVADLADRLVQMSVDMETGERLLSTEDLIKQVVDYAGVSYWRVGALSKIGLAADDYCEVTEGPMKIRIQRLDA